MHGHLSSFRSFQIRVQYSLALENSRRPASYAGYPIFMVQIHRVLLRVKRAFVFIYAILSYLYKYTHKIEDTLDGIVSVS